MDLSGAVWRKSSYSAEDGPALIFTPDEWRAFTAGVNGGEVDLA